MRSILANRPLFHLFRQSRQILALKQAMLGWFFGVNLFARAGRRWRVPTPGFRLFLFSFAVEIGEA